MPAAGGPQATVHGDRRARDEPGQVAEQEHDHRCAGRRRGEATPRRDRRRPERRRLGHRRGQLGVPLGRHPVRRDAVHPDPPVRQLEGERPGELLLGGLHGAVHGEPRCRLERLARGHVHDRPTRRHERHERAGHVDDAREVLGHERGVALGRGVQELGPEGPARVVHDPVHDTELGLDPTGELLDRSAITHVERPDHHPTTGTPQLGGDPVDLGVPVDDRQVTAERGDGPGGGPPDALRRSGDHDRPTRQRHVAGRRRIHLGRHLGRVAHEASTTDTPLPPPRFTT